MKTLRASSYMALLASAAIYAAFGVFIRELDKSYGDFFQITARSIVAVAILALLLLIRRTSLKVNRKDVGRVVAFAISFPIVVVFFTLAVLHTKVANAVLLLYGGSLIGAFVIGTRYFKETVTRQKLLALGLVLIGLLVYTQAWQGLVVGSGFLFGVIAGVFDGVANSLRKHVRDLPRNAILFYQYATSAVLSLCLAAITGEHLVKGLGLRALFLTFIFGLLLVFIGRLLLYGFKHSDVNIATVVLASELLFSVLLGWVLLREHPAGHELAGGVLIFAASIYSGLELPARGNKK